MGRRRATRRPALTAAIVGPRTMHLQAQVTADNIVIVDDVLYRMDYRRGPIRISVMKGSER
jgi:hypothetical protein